MAVDQKKLCMSVAHMSQALIPFVILILLASCARRPHPTMDIPLPETSQQRIFQYFRAVLNTFGNNRAEIISNLGEPNLIRTACDLSQAGELTAEDRRLIRGHGSGVENEIFELLYSGMWIKVLKVSSPPHQEGVYLLEVSSKRYKMPWNLGVGCQFKDVRRILGGPSLISDNGDYTYSVVHLDESGNPVGYEDSITFCYHKGKVERIRFWVQWD